VRKTLATVGNVGMGIFLAVSAIAPDTVFIWMLALAGAFMGVSACNIWAMTQTLAGPRMVGRWTGVQNFAGNIAGAVAPKLTGILLDRTGHFYWAFFHYGRGGLDWSSELDFRRRSGERSGLGEDGRESPALAAYPAPQSSPAVIHSFHEAGDRS